MKSSNISLAVSLSVLMSVSSVYAADDVELGHKEFNEDCSVCHSVKEGKNKIGPSLFGIVGRKAGSIADYSYSDAMRAYGASGAAWSAENIGKYIRDPQKMVPGAKMPFKLPEKETDQELANLLAYLATLH